MALMHCPLNREHAFVRFSFSFRYCLTCVSIFFSQIVAAVALTVLYQFFSISFRIGRVIILFPLSDLRMLLPWVNSLPTYLVSLRKFLANLVGFWMFEKSNTYPFRSAQRPPNGGAFTIDVLPLLLRKLVLVYDKCFVLPAWTFEAGCCLFSLILSFNLC